MMKDDIGFFVSRDLNKGFLVWTMRGFGVCFRDKRGMNVKVVICFKYKLGLCLVVSNRRFIFMAFLVKGLIFI